VAIGQRDLCPGSKLAGQKRTDDAIICHSNWPGWNRTPRSSAAPSPNPNYVKDIDWADTTVEVRETAEEAVVSKSARIAEDLRHGF
jgi:hypothetical protein